MGRYSPAIVNFNAGEWGPLAYARVDLQKYGFSQRLCRNFIPTIQGPNRKRPGSIYVAEVEDMAKKSRLIPYTVARNAAFMLEFAEGAINVYDAVGTDLSPAFSGVSPPWLEADIPDIQFAQTGDLLYLTHADYPVHVFEFDGSANASLTIPEFNTGPIREENTDQASTVTASGTTGTITLTATNAIFSATDVGGLFAFRTVVESLNGQWVASTGVGASVARWSESYERPGRVNNYRNQSGAGTTGTLAPGHDSGTESDGSLNWLFIHSTYGFVRITGFTDSMTVTGDVVGSPELPGDVTGGTFRWSFGAWSATNGYPRSVGFFEQRLILGGTTADPQTFWGSRINDFTDFSPDDISDAGPYSYALDSDQANPIAWILGGRNLFIGTQGGEFVASGGQIDAAITPTNIRVRRDSRHGSQLQNAVQVGASVLFVQAGGVTLREQLYYEERGGYEAGDLTILAHHLGQTGLNHIAYQAEPDNILWTYNNDGLLLGFTYNRQQEVLGWHRHYLGGADAEVESVQVIPDENGVNDRVWVIVKRTIDSAVTRYIELLDEGATDVWSDSSLLYSGAATNTITGLGHLEGEEVFVLGDGSVRPNETVTGGQITVEGPAVEAATVGLPLVAQMETQTNEGGSESGVSQGKSKRIHNVTFRLVETGPGLFVGPNENSLVQVVFRETENPMDNPVPPLTNDSLLTAIEDGYLDRGILFVEHNLPQPCTISAMWAQIEVYDAR